MGQSKQSTLVVMKDAPIKLSKEESVKDMVQRLRLAVMKVVPTLL